MRLARIAGAIANPSALLCFLLLGGCASLYPHDAGVAKVTADATLEQAYEVATDAVGQGSALEIEDIGEGSSDAGQEVWAGQGEDDRDDD